MKKCLQATLVLAIALAWSVSPAWAIKEFNDQFKDSYAKENKNAAFVKLVEDAKCNVCHIQGENKKKRNPYGEGVAKLLKKADFPKERFKNDPKKCKEEIEAALKKVEDMEGKDKVKFGAKIKDGQLPGGNVEGK
jgi:hypothetical protein